MTEQFTWIDIYQELATALLVCQDKQPELIAFLEDLRKQDYVISSLQDKNRDGERFLLKEIDPFTFIGVFNRGIRDEQRIAILAQVKQHFQLRSPVPMDFSGIPVLNNMKSWFFPYQSERGGGHIQMLWRIFQLALLENPLQDPLFLKTFDEALSSRGVNINLTMGLFWIRPNTFLSLDSVNRTYLGIDIPKDGLTSDFYISTLQEVSARGQSFPQLSMAAWQSTHKDTGAKKKPQQFKPAVRADCGYWLVGAYWDSKDPPDQTQRFLDEGVWENGYQDRYLENVKAMQVGDKIAIKAATTQRKGLPFDNQNSTISRMDIKAIGTIVANRDDGRIVEVEWDPDFQEKSWYFYTNRNTVWHLQTNDDYKFKEYSQRLIDFVWYGNEQDYDWFWKQWWQWKTGRDTKHDAPSISSLLALEPYSIEDIIASGVFLTKEELSQILNRMLIKKAILLQGSPGVGKNFIAKKLAYALMEEKDENRIEMVQFHQSYSYDDFIRGYRPALGQAGTFSLQNGIFYEFCKKAMQDPEREYVFLIDEINRGNLSQIFGELLMLIEADKRGPDFGVPLVYRNQDEPRFYVPENLYIIGLMNIADRSLAMVDYALRRRFAFITLKPQYESDTFRQWLLGRSMDSQLVSLIIERMSALNKAIREDSLLGENYQIGHSYFCPKGDNFAGLDRGWYRDIVQTEIVPMLKEYWFDNSRKVEEAERNLLA